MIDLAAEKRGAYGNKLGEDIYKDIYASSEPPSKPIQPRSHSTPGYPTAKQR